MKIFVKKLMIPLFLAASGDWTPDLDDALEFDDGFAAIEFSQKHHVVEAELYYRFENPVYDFSIKMNENSQT